MPWLTVTHLYLLFVLLLVQLRLLSSCVFSHLIAFLIKPLTMSSYSFFCLCSISPTLCLHSLKLLFLVPFIHPLRNFSVIPSLLILDRLVSSSLSSFISTHIHLFSATTQCLIFMPRLSQFYLLRSLIHLNIGIIFLLSLSLLYPFYLPSTIIIILLSFVHVHQNYSPFHSVSHFPSVLFLYFLLCISSFFAPLLGIVEHFVFCFLIYQFSSMMFPDFTFTFHVMFSNSSSTTEPIFLSYFGLQISVNIIMFPKISNRFSLFSFFRRKLLL